MPLSRFGPSVDAVLRAPPGTTTAASGARIPYPFPAAGSPTGPLPFVHRGLSRYRARWWRAQGTSLPRRRTRSPPPRRPVGHEEHRMTAPNSTSTRHTPAPVIERVRPTDIALLVGLRAAGVPAPGILRLVQLRAACRCLNPALDGFTPDARTRF